MKDPKYVPDPVCVSIYPVCAKTGPPPPPKKKIIQAKISSSHPMSFLTQNHSITLILNVFHAPPPSQGSVNHTFKVLSAPKHFINLYGTKF